ncbi:MAG: CdaR family protein [Candidatus Dormibacteraeota bacterium]|nr:CdaR family protein [Candidatus Dormibacteraeota bacterium]
MRVPDFATRNIKLKGLAAGLAAVLWAGVAYASNPPDTRTVSVAVPQESASVAPFTLVRPIPDLVVRVSGTREHLTAFQPADLVVSVNYGVIRRAGIQALPVSVINNDRDVALDNPPTSISAEVDRVASRNVVVTVDYSQHPPPQGYVVVNKDTTPKNVTVIGPEHQLASIEAKVTVDLANQKTNFQADETVVPVEAATGQRVGSVGITVAGQRQRQTSVLVTIEVAAVLTSRATAVLPKVSGSAGPSHFLEAETVSPATVVLNGPQDLLNTLDSVLTETISLNGITGTLSFTVNVVPPAGVTASPGRVTVTITVGSIAQPSPVPSATPAPTPSPTPTPTPSPT